MLIQSLAALLALSGVVAGNNGNNGDGNGHGHGNANGHGKPSKPSSRPNIVMIREPLPRFTS